MIASQKTLDKIPIYACYIKADITQTAFHYAIFATAIQITESAFYNVINYTMRPVFQGLYMYAACGREGEGR